MHQLGERFDMTEEYEREVRPRMEELVNLCASYGMPITLNVAVAGAELKGEGGDDGVRFSVVSITNGTFMRMPIEMLIGIMGATAQLGEPMRDSYRRHLAYILSGKKEMDENDRTDYRVAMAYAVLDNALPHAAERIARDAEIAKTISMMYMETAAIENYLSFMNTGGSQ